jgi:CubicO group peptidase (beta-lactamase class C family)
MRIPLAAAAIVTASTAALAEPATNPALEARLNHVIDMALSEKRIVGTVVLVAKDGEIVYSRAPAMPTARPASRCGKMRSSASPP